MPSPCFRALFLVLRPLLLAAVPAFGHTVPDTAVEAVFSQDGTYALTVNLDPRAFLAANPATLPPVPASWYLGQTPEQAAATHQKAGEYIRRCVRLMFNGHAAPLPPFTFQAINGATNAPIDADAQEVHVLAVARGSVPPGASSFQIDYAKEATTALILLSSQSGQPAPRAQAVFAGEMSKEVLLSPGPSAPPPPPPPAQAAAPSGPGQGNASAPSPPPGLASGASRALAGGAGAGHRADARASLGAETAAQSRTAAQPAAAAESAAAAAGKKREHLWLALVSSAALICILVGWRLLVRYRHHHRWHRRPPPV